MLDINSLPNQTEHDREIILKATNGMIWSIIGRGTESLDADSLDDLYCESVEAANRAIHDYQSGTGATLATLINRYVVQARRDFIRRRMTKKRIPDSAVCFSDLPNDIESIPCGDLPFEGEEDAESARHAAMIQDMEIIIDRARNDGVLSSREYRMLVSRRTGGTYRRMAEDEGMSPGGVYKIIEATVAKIRLAYRTAE